VLPSVLRPVFIEAVADGYVRTDGDDLVLTEVGAAEFTKVADAWKAWLRTKLPDRDGGPSSEALDAALRRLAIRVGEQEQLAPAGR